MFTNTFDQTALAGNGTLTVTKQVEGAGEGCDTSKRFGFAVIIGGIKHEITLADGDEYVFSGIPVGTPYNVTERDYSKDGYIAENTGGMGTFTKDGVIVSFTNRFMPVIGNGSLIVTKSVTGRFIDTTKAFHFTVTIGNEIYDFTLRHGESKAFKDIPAGVSYSAVEDDYYSEGYVTRSTGVSGSIQHGVNTAKFINDYTGMSPPKPDFGMVQVSGQKTWVHGKNPPVSQPAPRKKAEIAAGLRRIMLAAAAFLLAAIGYVMFQIVSANQNYEKEASIHALVLPYTGFFRSAAVC